MASINTKLFRVHNAAQLFESISEADETAYYMLIGRAAEWSDDLNPPTPTDAVANTSFAYWTDAFAMKKIAATDLSHAIPRVDWTTNTVYTQYDHRTANLSNHYVLTSSFNVYKCLFNASNANSTVEPSGTGNTVITTGDGYKWKFMYQISTSEALNFLTSTFMPVKTLTSDDDSVQWDVQQYANTSNGAIDVVLVSAGGNNYASGTTTVTIAGDGTGATATATVSANVVTAITVTARGSGYSWATATVTDSGSGTGATAIPIIAPPGYHGADAVKELGGHYIMLTGRFAGTESNTISDQIAFRRIMLVKDPLLLADGSVASASTYRLTTNMTLASVTGTYSSGETVTGGTSGATGVVIDWNQPGNSNVLRVVSANGTFANAELITGGTSGAIGTTNAVSAPLIRTYTGDTLYVEQRAPITRANDQTEVLRVILAF